MTPYLFFVYMLALAGGIFAIGFIFLILFVLYIFVRGLMLLGDKK